MDCVIEINSSDLNAKSEMNAMNMTNKKRCTKHSFMAGDEVAPIEIRLNATSRIFTIAVRHSRRNIYTLKEDNGSPVNTSHTAQ